MAAKIHYQPKGTAATACGYFQRYMIEFMATFAPDPESLSMLLPFLLSGIGHVNKWVPTEDSVERCRDIHGRDFMYCSREGTYTYAKEVHLWTSRDLSLMLSTSVGLPPRKWVQRVKNDSLYSSGSVSHSVYLRR
jgi:hypothetical protein